jgi:hypothetical protein
LLTVKSKNLILDNLMRFGIERRGWREFLRHLIHGVDNHLRIALQTEAGSNRGDLLPGFFRDKHVELSFCHTAIL